MHEHEEFMVDVLVHNDFHTFNIMFQKENGELSDQVAAIIDFQVCIR
jgi:aminoglycoside/choline kinase family phosphotransferase